MSTDLRGHPWVACFQKFPSLLQNLSTKYARGQDWKRQKEKSSCMNTEYIDNRWNLESSGIVPLLFDIRGSHYRYIV
jgi:hypothetical protein